MKLVYIAYGFSEGPGHASRFISALKKAGYLITRSVNEAEIIVAHSGGLYTLPYTSFDKQLIIVGPTYLNDKKLLSCFAQNIRQNFNSRISFFSWLAMMVKYPWYFITSPALTYKMHKNWRNYAEVLKQLGKGKGKITLVRNSDDAFCSPTIEHKLSESISYLQLSGKHDDIWFNPNRYMELLK